MGDTELLPIVITRKKGRRIPPVKSRAEMMMKILSEREGVQPVLAVLKENDVNLDAKENVLPESCLDPMKKPCHGGKENIFIEVTEKESMTNNGDEIIMQAERFLGDLQDMMSPYDDSHDSDHFPDDPRNFNHSPDKPRHPDYNTLDLQDSDCHPEDPQDPEHNNYDPQDSVCHLEDPQDPAHNSDDPQNNDWNPDDPGFKPDDPDYSPMDLEHNTDSDSESNAGRSQIEDETQLSSRTKKPKKIYKCATKFREDQKRKREIGEAYKGMKKASEEESGNGKYDYQVPRPAREMIAACNCKMSLKSKKLNCRSFNEIQRKEMYTNFWKSMKWDAKRAYVHGLVDVVQPKFLLHRKGDPNFSRREQTLKYHLKHDGQRLMVCKTMFLNTLGLSHWWVLECVNRNKQAMQLSCAELAEHELEDDEPSAKSCAVTARHKRKIDALRNFLNSLPKMESHYCRQNTNKLYLEPLFQSKTDVFNLYKSQVDKPDGPGSVSIQTFYTEFDRLHLSVYIPRKDLCDICVSYATGNCSQEKYEEHQARKELARKEKCDDNEGTHFVVTMDLQGVLLCPRLNASSLYYKMKLCVHNFTLFNNKTKQVKCYVWHEGEGGITSNEFASLITSFIRSQSLLEDQDVILWSDGAGYQNRNVNLSMALLNLSKELSITIIQKYLEVGHTQMECDSIHATIERKVKNKTISTPADYVNIMRTARKNPFPYDVEYIDHAAFKDFAKLGPMRSIRPGSKAGDPCVNDIRALKYTSSGEMYFKLSFSEDWSLFETRKKRSMCSSADGLITDLYNGPLKIKPDKYTHLQQLKNVIDRDYHAFYDNLSH